MGQRHVFSDGHMGQSSIYRFKDDQGGLLRPWASSAEEADEIMVEAWNKVVHPKDTVYHLGDVAISRNRLQFLGRMNGRKILIRGNHDIFKLKDYLPWFDDILGSAKKDNCILSHYPIHPDSIPHWCPGNIHGHTHSRDVMMTDATGARVQDPRYLNACVEKLGIAPVPLEALVTRLKSQNSWVDTDTAMEEI